MKNALTVVSNPESLKFARTQWLGLFACYRPSNLLYRIHLPVLSSPICVGTNDGAAIVALSKPYATTACGSKTESQIMANKNKPHKGKKIVALTAIAVAVAPINHVVALMLVAVIVGYIFAQ